jgi:hypothetical protein
MKALIAALALATLLASPTFAQRGSHQHNESPASPSYQTNGW